jgi:hypothetical protein
MPTFMSLLYNLHHPNHPSPAVCQQIRGSEINYAKQIVYPLSASCQQQAL